MKILFYDTKKYDKESFDKVLPKYEDIEIEYTGLRPGEKLYEELLMNEEGMQTTENSRIFIGRQIAFDEKVFREQIKELAKEAENECPDICYLVKKMVPEYQYEGEKQG